MAKARGIAREAARPGEPVGDSGGERGKAATVVLLFILLALALKLPVWSFPHTETDEEIYWQLTSNWLRTGHYSLQGTEILKSISPRIYDRPLFHHPPLFPALLAPFVLAGARQAAILVPWAGHLLAIVAVALFGRALLAGRSPGASPFSPLFWLPLLGVTLDPILIFLSRRLWMDSVLAGLTALSVAFFFLAARSPRRRALLLAGGVTLGLASLVKLTALLAVPAVALLLLSRLRAPAERREVLLFGALPAVLLVLPWLALFLARYGVLFPSWIAPDAWSLSRFPFVRATVARPAAYYLKELSLAQPLFPLGIAVAFRRFRRADRAVLPALVVWIGLSLLALSWLGATGTGFQMRYLSPMLPALYLVFFALWEEGDAASSFLPLAVLVAAVYAGLGGIVNLTSLLSDDFVSLVELGARPGG